MSPQNIEEFVERQVLRWKEEGRQAAARFAPLPGHVRGPVIALSREHGAWGARIARQVAERLEFAYYDRELVDRIASQAHVRNAVVESVDERVRNRFADWLTEVIGGERLSGSAYVDHLSSVLLSIAYHGKAVIVGRGACVVLDPRTTLRVRVQAPLEVRIARVAESHDLTKDEARADVNERDESRIHFAKRHFGRDSNDPHLYDLVVDTGTLPVEACIGVIQLAFLARFAGFRTP